jgi:hypothetical protein
MPLNYPEFAEQYLNLKVYPTHKPLIDAVTDPTVNRIIATMPPEFGKSTHISLGYVLWSIVRNFDIRIALITKSQTKAQDLLHRIKRYLTEEDLYHTAQRNLIREYGGFQPPRGTHRWELDQITVRQRKSGERDPTVQALGVGAQIYGTRLDLVIMDDALTLENQMTETRRERISSWFLQEVLSRALRGRVIILGTRVHPHDNYHVWDQLWKDDPHYRRVKVPAIVEDENGIEQSSWPEFWPLEGQEVWDPVLQANRYQKGLYDIRQEMGGPNSSRWRLVYQQEDLQETDSVFTADMLGHALELGATRRLGTVEPEEILILGVDPAVTGRAAAILIGYNPRTRIRTVIDLFVGHSLGATGIREKLLYKFWEKYRPQRTVIETNYAPTLLGDQLLRDRARAYGTLLVPHITHAGNRRGGKWDQEYGVAALAPLIAGGLYVFPSATPADRTTLRPLLEDMAGFPYREEQDALMALWIAEGETRLLKTASLTQKPETVIEGRALPPRIARRLLRKT